MPVFAFLAALAFGLALLLDLINEGGQFIGPFTLAGFLFLALHFAVGAPWPWPRRNP